MPDKLLQYRVLKDKVASKAMFVLTLSSLVILIAIGYGLYNKSTAILKVNSLWELLSGSIWETLRGKFGFYSFILSSVYVTLLAVGIAFPVSLLSSLYITENAKTWVKKMIFPVLDILSGIPPVVYGMWGTLVIVPWISDSLGPKFVDYTTGYTVLAGGIVLSIMIIPIMISLFVEIISTISKDLRDAAASLGATRWQISRMIVIRKATPGLIATVVLAVSRTFGETLAVLMVCGNVIQIPKSLFEGCYPISALIANNYGEMLSIPLYESALMFAALILFSIILIFNIVSRLMLYQVKNKLKL
jgi:phosphate transport system permease protein